MDPLDQINENATETAYIENISLAGTYYHSLDAKGRINFPARLRDIIGETFWVARALTGHFLAVYSLAGWLDMQQQLMGRTGPRAEALLRWFNAGAMEVTPDKQGRILIPGNLREYANLEKDVVVIGAGRKAEIWDLEAFRAQDEAFDPMADPSDLEGISF